MEQRNMMVFLSVIYHCTCKFNVWICSLPILVAWALRVTLLPTFPKPTCCVKNDSRKIIVLLKWSLFMGNFIFVGSNVVSIPDGQTLRWMHTDGKWFDPSLHCYSTHKTQTESLKASKNRLQQVALPCLPGNTISAEENSFPRRATRPGRARNGRRGISRRPWMPWFLPRNAPHRILQATWPT